MVDFYDFCSFKKWCRNLGETHHQHCADCKVWGNDAIAGSKNLAKISDVLGQIELAKQQGYALCDQELELGLRSIAVPISDRSGQVVAAMSLSVATSRMDIPTILEKLWPELERAKQKLMVLL